MSEALINESLAPMEARRYVVEQCLKRVAGDYEGQEALLEYGLRETARHCGPAGGAGGAEGDTGGEGPHLQCSSLIQVAG